jgi:non-ribosomal peptide synthetase component F
LDRSFDFLSAVLACVLNCITFIPVDKTNSLSRLETIVKESDAKFVLSDALFDIVAEIILASEASDKKREKFKVKYQKNKAVYYIYTSGTTGKPKCIPIAQKNLNNYLMWANEKYKTKQQMVAPLFTSLSVDLTITSTLLPFLNGGAVKVFPGNFNQSIIKQILMTPKLTSSNLRRLICRFGISLQNSIIA